MEKNKPLIKDRKPGEMSIRGTISKPDITVPAQPQPALKVDPRPRRRPFEDETDA